jgi:hypothetical protein
MSPVARVDKALRGLPLSDKIGALIVHLCSRDVDAIATIGGLISVMGIVGQNLPDEFNRRQCAMAMREAATEIEAEHVPLRE